MVGDSSADGVGNGDSCDEDGGYSAGCTGTSRCLPLAVDSCGYAVGVGQQHIVVTWGVDLRIHTHTHTYWL